MCKWGLFELSLHLIVQIKKGLDINGNVTLTRAQGSTCLVWTTTTQAMRN
jgi:hypothetical protein